MANQKLTNIIGKIRRTVRRRSPEILTGIGIAGMITTTITAVRATPKALQHLEAEKQEKSVDKLTPIETIKTTWKYYIPSTIICGISISCLIGATSVNYRRNAALSAAYTLSETALRDYREKTIETVGEKKEQSIRDAVAKDKIENRPVNNTEVIITDKGDVLCYDTISDRYFKSDINTLKKAANTLSRQMMDEGYVSLNDFYYEIGLKPTKIGHDLGWSIDWGYLDLKFSTQMSDDDRPCIVVDYVVPPQYDYYKRM